MSTNTTRNYPEIYREDPYLRLAVVYNPFDLSDIAVNHLVYDQDKTLADYMAGLPEEVSWIVGYNGQAIEADGWAAVKPDPFSTLSLVRVPEGGKTVKSILRVVAMIAVMIIAPELGPILAFGVMGLQVTAIATTIATAAVGIIGGMVVNAVLSPSSKAQSKADSPTYGVDGPKNTAKEGAILPVIYGKYRVGGNVIDEFTKNVGDQQYLYLRTALNDGKVKSISDILLNDQPIASFKDALYTVSLGEDTATPNDWFDEAIRLHSVNSKITTAGVTHQTDGPVDRIRADIVFPYGLYHSKKDGSKENLSVTFGLQYRTIDSYGAPTSGYSNLPLSDGSPLTDAGGGIFNTPAGTSFVSLGVQTQASSGDSTIYSSDIFYRAVGDTTWIPASTLTGVPTTPFVGGVAGTPEFPIVQTPVSLPAPGAWQLKIAEAVMQIDKSIALKNATAGASAITGLTVIDNSSSPKRITYESARLTRSRYELRVTRTVDSEYPEDKYLSETILTDVGEIDVANVNLNGVANVGVRILLNDQLSGVPTITALVEGCEVAIYDDEGNVTSTAWSDNPADIVADILTHPERGAAYPISKLVMPALADFRDFCTLNNFKFNGVFDTLQSTWDSVQQVAKVGLGSVHPRGTKFSMIFDAPANPVMVFGPGNILKDSFKKSWLPLADRANELHMQFADATDSYKQKTIRNTDEVALGMGKRLKQATIDGFGITDVNQAKQFNDYNARQNIYINEFITLDAPLEAIGLNVGNVALIQHDSINFNNGSAGRLASGSSSTVIKLDRPAHMETGKTYSLIVVFDAIQRYTCHIDSKSGDRLTVSGLPTSGMQSFTRIIQGGHDVDVLRVIASGTPGTYYLNVDDATSLAAGSASVWETDVIEQQDVTLNVGDHATVVVSTAFTSAPPQFANFMFGEKETLKLPYRLRGITGTDIDHRTLTFIKYDARCYLPGDFGSVVLDSAPKRTIDQVTVLHATYDPNPLANQERIPVTIAWQHSGTMMYGGADIHVSRDAGVTWSSLATVQNVDSIVREFSRREVLMFKVVSFDNFMNRARFADAPTTAVTITTVDKAIDAPTSPTYTVPFWHTDASASVTWTIPADALATSYQIQYKPLTSVQYAAFILVTDPTLYASVITSDTDYIARPDVPTPAASLPQLQVGDYVVRTRSVRGFANSDWIYFPLEVAAPALPVNITNVKLNGGTADLTTDSFTGKDALLTWDNILVQAAAMTGVGVTGLPHYWQDYQVRILDTLGGTVLRTEYVTDPSYTYTFAKNAQDSLSIGGGVIARRSFVIEVSLRGVQGQVSSAHSITCTNPSPLLSSVSVSELTGLDGFQLIFTRPTTPDYEGIVVWSSTTSGFTPGSGNIVWQAAGNPTFHGITGTIYYKYALYDVFGLSSLDVSSQGSASPIGVDPVAIAAAEAAAIAAEVAAAASATTAATQAAAAATSAAGAVTSASTATTQATAAATSATNAATSATGASGSATTATTQATAASTAATTAATQATNAATSATAAAGSATTATTQATNATTQASNAATSATTAAGSATAAGTSATAAAGSATTASTQATNAGTSATAASASAVSAQLTAAALLPSDFNQLSEFWTADSAGAPSAVVDLALGTFQSVSGIGETYRVTGANVGYAAAAVVRSKGVFLALANRTYRVTAVMRGYANPTSGSATMLVGLQQLDNVYAAQGAVTMTNAGGKNFSQVVHASDGWVTLCGEFTVASTPLWPFLRAKAQTDNGGTADGTWEVASIRVEDTTSQNAAAGSASAAATSASAASTSQTAAGTSASAAATSATNASTSAGTASTQATNASNSATTATTQANNASTSATTAASSATAAAGSATSASTSATSASTSASTATTQASNASTSAGAAATSATAAGGSATAAAGSATTASTQATNSGNSATAAAASATAASSSYNAAQVTAAALFPSSFDQGDRFWSADYNHLDETTYPPSSYGWTYTTVTGVGSVAQASVSGTYRDIGTIGVQKVVAGRRYRSTVVLRVLTNPTNGNGSHQTDLTLYGIYRDSTGAYATNAGVNSAANAASGWVTLTIDWLGDTIIAAGDVYLSPLVRVGLLTGGSGTVATGAVYQVSSILFQDVTDSYNAAASATAASTSATAAATSATSAGTSATTATTQASTATTAAGTATTQATNAASSATSAAGSATTSTTQASNSATSATAAAGSATAAAGSATTAATQASAASTSASGAATSATAAGTSATAASGSATTATTQAGNASTSATAASTSATGAAASATSATASATTATTQAGNASTSASAASTSAAGASTSATNAATSATNAASSATSASGSVTTATAQAALASASATLAAKVGSDSLMANSTFANWTSGATLPDTFSDWQSNAATTVSKVTGQVSPNAVRTTFVASGASQGWLSPAANNQQVTPGWYVVEATVTLVSGAFLSQGIYIQFTDNTSETEHIAFSISGEKDISDTVIGSGTAGRTYRIAKLAQITNAASRYMQPYAMGSWSNFGAVTSSCTMDWHKLSVRVASAAEIAANRADANASTALANITTEATARATADTAITTAATTLSSTVAGNTASIGTQALTLADHTGKLQAYLKFIAAAGADPAFIQMNADNLGSALALAATSLSLLNPGTAHGTITVGTPANNDTIVVNGVTITWKTSGATGSQVNIGGSAAASAAALTTFLLASSSGSLTPATYGANGAVVNITYLTSGTGGNAYTLSKTGSGVTLSGATLTGGASQSFLPILQIASGVVNIAGQLNVGSGNFLLDPSTGTMQITAGSAKFVIGTSFGASSNLTMWFGPSMAVSAMTKANAAMWFDNAGSAYFGGSLSAGTLTTKAATSSTASNAVAETAVFASNGGTIHITLSYTFDAHTNQTYAPGTGSTWDTDKNAISPTPTGISGGVYTSGPNSESAATTVDLYRSINGGAYSLVTTLSVTGTWTWTGERPNSSDPGYATLGTANGGSLTYTDPSTVAQNRQYKAVINTRTAMTTAAAAQNISVICTE